MRERAEEHARMRVWERVHERERVWVQMHFAEASAGAGCGCGSRRLPIPPARYGTGA